MKLEKEMISDFKQLNSKNRAEAYKAINYLKLGQENAGKDEKPALTVAEEAQRDWEEFCLADCGYVRERI